MRRNIRHRAGGPWSSALQSSVIAMCVALLLCGAAASFVMAAPSQQLVDPADISTPTPHFDIILQPTATPSPTSTGDFATLAPMPEMPVYTVQDGDTLFSVALEIGVDVAQMPCAVAPTFNPAQPLVIGDTIQPPPLGRQCHVVAPGDTLQTVAARYGVSTNALRAVAWNQLSPNMADDAPLSISYLRVPTTTPSGEGEGFLGYMLAQPVGMSPIMVLGMGGTRQMTREIAGPMPKDWPYGSGNFAWPVYGWLSQGYRYDHPAVDIAAPADTFVTAADRGVVIRAGWNDQGYGLFVVIDHNIDYVTLYGHMDEVYVREGDIVAQGQILGTVGSTGNSTGPHLHFEIRDFGRRTNPLELLSR